MYIGLDLGTSGLKAVLFDAGQQPLAEATAPLTVARPHDGWSEQDPADWIAACETAMAALAEGHDLSAVRALGLSGQMHGATLLDAADKVLRPCILWNDTRAAAEAAELDALPAFRARTGNIVFPGFTAPKLVWVARHEPAIFARTAKVLLPKDYLRLWLTGEAVSEMSDAAGTAWLDVGARDWSEPLLTASGMTREQMPRLVEGAENSGALRGELARKWGMKATVGVAGGAGDNAAAAIGVGAVAAGQGFVSLGTSGVLFAATDSFCPAPETAVHSFCHALPGTWHQMGVILAATDALNWLSGITGRSPAQMTAELGDLTVPGPVTFLPYLGGERTPHNDARIRGAFLGLDHATGSGDMTSAVLNGVAFAFRDNLDALAATGTTLSDLIGVGGGTGSIYWVRAIATALNLPIGLPDAGDYGAAFGAARLAMLSDQGETDLSPPRIARMIAPDPALTDAYADAQNRYRAAYSALRGDAS